MDSSFTGLEKLKWKFEILLSFICKSEVWAHTALFGGQLLQFSNSQNHNFIHTALSLSLLLGSVKLSQDIYFWKTNGCKLEQFDTGQLFKNNIFLSQIV